MRSPIPARNRNGRPPFFHLCVFVFRWFKTLFVQARLSEQEDCLASEIG